MGLNERTESNKKIVMIKHNGLCVESKEPMAGYVEKEVDIPGTDDGTGKPETMIKYIKKFRSLSGFVTKLEWYDTGDTHKTQYLGVKIHMKDGDEEFILDIPYNRRYFNVFCKMAENIDFTKEVEFWADKDKSSDHTAFGAEQDGQPVKHRYTKANPGPCPPGKQNTRTKKWDFTDQNEWLLNRMLDVIIPTVNAQLGADEKASAAVAGGDVDRWADVEDPIHAD